MNREPAEELAHYRELFAEATREADRARAVREEAVARAEAAEQRERGLESIVVGLETLARAQQPVQQARLPIEASAGRTASTNGKVETPRGREAVRIILKETGRAWRAGELTREIQNRGWIKRNARDPEAAIRQALRRLIEEGSVEQSGTGLYRHKLPGDAGEDVNRALGTREAREGRKAEGNAAAKR